MLLLLAGGCQMCGPRMVARRGPSYDRPFPFGQVSDAIWETQQTNAEASDFVFYDHEFEGNTPELSPGGKKKLAQVALRLEHVPFPVVIEESPQRRRPKLDAARRDEVVAQLTRLGVDDVAGRVVIASALAEGITAMEGEQAYYQTVNNNFAEGGGAGRRFGGLGGFFR